VPEEGQRWGRAQEARPVDHVSVAVEDRPSSAGSRADRIPDRRPGSGHVPSAAAKPVRSAAPCRRSPREEHFPLRMLRLELLQRLPRAVRGTVVHQDEFLLHADVNGKARPAISAIVAASLYTGITTDSFMVTSRIG